MSEQPDDGKITNAGSEINNVAPNVAEGMIGTDVPPTNEDDKQGEDDIETDAFPIISEDEASEAKVDKLVAELAADFKPVVEKIESGIKTTQNNYGRYMALLSQLGAGDKNKSGIMALALIKAGANRNGVGSAYKLLFP